MFSILLSYWIRTKRNLSRIVLLFCPITFTCVFTFYLSVSNNLKGAEIDSFFLAYLILAYFSISFFIPMLYDIDKKAGMFANDLRCGINRKKIFFARFLFIIILLIIIELIAVIPFTIFLKLNAVIIEMPHLIICMIICPLTLMSVIPIYQFLSLKYNYSGSILTGAFFTLASILLGTTGLGDGIWYYLPFAYPIKLMFSYTVGSLSTDNIIKFLTIIFFISLLVLLFFSFWYNKWDGISNLED